MGVTQEQVRHFFEIWDTYSGLPGAEKVAILRAYLTKVLGVSDKVADAFSKGDQEAQHTVGMKQSSVTCKDTRPFWQEVWGIRQEDYTEEDIQALSGPEDIYAVFALLNRMEPLLRETTNLGERINQNAHIYK